MCENQYQCEFNTTADCFDEDNLTEMFKKLNKGDEATTAEMMTTAKSETESNAKLELDVIQNKIAEFDKIGVIFYFNLCDKLVLREKKSKFCFLTGILASCF